MQGILDLIQQKCGAQKTLVQSYLYLRLVDVLSLACYSIVSVPLFDHSPDYMSLFLYIISEVLQTQGHQVFGERTLSNR